MMTDITKYERRNLKMFAELKETKYWEALVDWLDSYCDHQSANALRLDSQDEGLAASHAQYKGRVLTAKRLKRLVETAEDIMSNINRPKDDTVLY